MVAHNKIKIAFVVNSVLPGGAERIILDLCRGLDHSRFEVVVISMKADEVFGSEASRSLRPHMEQAGARVIAVSPRLRTRVRDLFALYRIFRKERPDIVHTYLPLAGTFGRIAGRAAGVHAIVSTQCNIRVAYDFWGYWIDRLLLPLAHAWTGASECIEEEYGRSIKYMDATLWKAGRRHFSIPAGVDGTVIRDEIARMDRHQKRTDLGLRDSDVMLMTTARLVPWKGHEDLIAAMKFLPENVHAFCAGWGHRQESLQALARELGVPERVHFLGARSDIYQLLGAADIYVQPFSRTTTGLLWKGPCTAQMEACSAGVPSICTRIPLIEYLIRDGETGKLAEVNDPKSLADAIRWMIDHPLEARRLGDAGKAVADDRYSLSRMIHSYTQLYDRVTEDH